MVLSGLALLKPAARRELARLVGRVLQLEGRLAEPRIGPVDLAIGGPRQPVQELHDRVAVDRQVGRLAQADVGPRRALDQRGMVVPDVRRHVLLDPHAALLEACHRVGRRRLDHVDRVGEQRRGARRILRRHDQHQPVGLRDALGIPVGFVLDQLGALARHEAGQLERAGARRLRGELVPVLAELLPLGRARHQEPQHLIGEERVDRLGLDLDLHLAGLPVAGDRRQARAHLRGLALVELRRVLVEDLLQVPDDGVGVEGRAVMELHAVAQREGPQGLVRLVHLPLGGEAGDQLARPVGDIELPGDERIVEREAGELVGTGATVGLARRQRHVGHGDAEAHHLLLRERRGTAARRARRRQQTTERRDSFIR